VARSVNEGFEEFLGRLTPTEAQRAAGAQHRASVKAALEAKLSVRNFFETGSFSHGTGVRGYSDVDALVSIGDDRPGSSYTALNWVKDALSHEGGRVGAAGWTARSSTTIGTSSLDYPLQNPGAPSSPRGVVVDVGSRQNKGVSRSGTNEITNEMESTPAI